MSEGWIYDEHSQVTGWGEENQYSSNYRIVSQIKEIRSRVGRTRWPTTRKIIYRGCYDVWHDEEDRINSQAVVTYQLQKAVDDGLIYKEGEE